MDLIGAGGQGFLNTVFTFILNALITLANTIVEIFISPLFALIEAIFPSLDDARLVFSNFLAFYAIPGINFARELFLNVTGYPRDLLQMLALIFVAKITYHITIIPIRFIYRIVTAVLHLNFGDNSTGSTSS